MTKLSTQFLLFYATIKIYWRKIIRRFYFDRTTECPDAVEKHYYEKKEQLLVKLLQFPMILAEDHLAIETAWANKIIDERPDLYTSKIYIAVFLVFGSINYALNENLLITALLLMPLAWIPVEKYIQKHLEKHNENLVDKFLECLVLHIRFLNEVVDYMGMRRAHMFKCKQSTYISSGNDFLQFAIRRNLEAYEVFKDVILNSEDYFKYDSENKILFNEFDLNDYANLKYEERNIDLLKKFEELYSIFILTYSNFICWIGVVMSHQSDLNEEYFLKCITQVLENLKPNYEHQVQNFQVLRRPIFEESQAAVMQKDPLRSMYNTYISKLEIVMEMSKNLEKKIAAVQKGDNLEEICDIAEYIVKELTETKKKASEVLILMYGSKNIEDEDMSLKPAVIKTDSVVKKIVDLNPTQNEPTEDEEYELTVTASDLAFSKNHDFDEPPSKKEPTYTRELMSELRYKLFNRQMEKGGQVFHELLKINALESKDNVAGSKMESSKLMIGQTPPPLPPPIPSNNQAIISISIPPPPPMLPLLPLNSKNITCDLTEPTPDSNVNSSSKAMPPPPPPPPVRPLHIEQEDDGKPHIRFRMPLPLPTFKRIPEDVYVLESDSSSSEEQQHIEGESTSSTHTPTVSEDLRMSGSLSTVRSVGTSYSDVTDPHSHPMEEDEDNMVVHRTYSDTDLPRNLEAMEQDPPLRRLVGERGSAPDLMGVGQQDSASSSMNIGEVVEPQFQAQPADAGMAFAGIGYPGMGHARMADAAMADAGMAGPSGEDSDSDDEVVPTPKRRNTRAHPCDE